MADNFDNYSMKVQARVDMPSNKDIDAQIRKLEKSISKLKVSGQFDDTALKNLTNQLNSLKATILTANFSPTALTELTNQVNRALQNINIGNINVGNIGNQAQQVGQQIGNNIEQGVASGVNKAKSELKSFSDLTNFSELNKNIEHLQIDPSALKNYSAILDEVKEKYAEFGQVKITNEQFNNGILEKFKVNIEQVNGDLKETKSFMMSLNDDKDTFVFNGIIKGSESVVQHLDKTKNAVNQTADAINALKYKAQSDKIQLSYDTGSYQSKIDSLVARTNQWVNANGEARISTESLQTALSNLGTAYNNLNSSGGNTVANQQALIEAEKALDAEVKRVQSSVTSMNATMAKSSAVDALRQKYQQFYDLNTASHGKYGKLLLSAISELAPGAEVTTKRVQELNQQLIQTINICRQTGKLGLSRFDSMMEQAKKFTQWVSVASVVTEGVQAVKQLISVSKELDAVMTDFTMATGTTGSQLEALTESYSKLADKLKSTTTDVMTSATEWIKQGQSIADTETLVSNSMILSKIGKLDSADATKYLTSAMKGYKVSVDDTLSVVDKLSAVDMASATDVGGLAEGMSEVAASADLAGVSMDKLLGYLAAIGETTQSGMSEVGTTLNAVFSRMGNIKLSRLKDYDNNGEDLSNVETVLRGVGISLRDSANSFRDFDKVLDETANNWSNYSDVQQRAIASAFAGTHHMNEFIVLMENYDKALEYTEKSLNSSGEAMDKFSAYEKSVEAHTESFTNAIQSLSDTAVDSGLVNFFIDLGTTGVKAIDGLINALTPLGTIGLGAGLFASFKNAGREKCYPSYHICL